MDVEKQVAIIWAASNGYTDDVPVESVRDFEAQFMSFLDNAKGSLLEAIRTKKAIDDDVKAQLKSAVEEFKERYEAKAAA